MDPDADGNSKEPEAGEPASADDAADADTAVADDKIEPTSAGAAVEESVEGEEIADEEIADDGDDDAPLLFGKPARRRRRSRAAAYLGIIAAVTAFMLLVGAASAYAYDQSRLAEIVPDTRIGGILVGGLTRDQAAEQLDRYVDSIKSRQFTVSAYDKAYSVSLAQLDMEADVQGLLDQAFSQGSELGVTGRLQRWLAGGGSNIDIELAVRPNSETIEKKIVSNIAGQVNREPTEASVDEKSGDVIFKPAGPGIELDTSASISKLTEAATSLAAGKTITEVTLPYKEIQPPAGKEIGSAILVRVSEQKLYYYENANLIATYKVSTGTGSYPTPLGRFKVVKKIMNPSWTNPQPNGWGKDMPASIGPGPNNPLGTRALELSAPGILIHGTTKVNLLGSPASHGCVRMAGDDIEGLFPKVPEDTPVFIHS